MTATPSANMAYDPFYTSSPSDSGLLDGADLPYTAGVPAPRRDARVTNVPLREDYEAPVPSKASASAPEDSLRDVPLPDGFLARLRGLVNEL